VGLQDGDLVVAGLRDGSNVGVKAGASATVNADSEREEKDWISPKLSSDFL